MWWVLGAFGLGFFFLRGRKRALVDVAPATDDPTAFPMVTGHTYFVVARTPLDSRAPANASRLADLWTSKGFGRASIKPNDVDRFVSSATATWLGGPRLRESPDFRVISAKDMG